MKKILNICLIFIAFLSISACDSSKPLELIYYDREKFILASADEEDDDKNVFLCVKGKTDEETKKRATEANNYYSVQLKLIVEEFTNGFMGKIEEDAKSESDESDFSVMDGIKAGLKLQEKSEELGIEIEKKYQCMLIDTIGSD